MMLHVVSQGWFLTASCPYHGQGKYLWHSWESLLQTILQWDSQKSVWRCFSTCAGYGSSLMQILSHTAGQAAVQRCCGNGGNGQALNHLWSLWVAVTISQGGGCFPVNSTYILIKCGWSVLSWKAGHVDGVCPKTWQRFVSGDISGSVQYQPKCQQGSLHGSH